MDLRWVQPGRLKALSASRWAWIAGIWFVGIPVTILAWGLARWLGYVIGAGVIVLVLLLMLDDADRALAAERDAEKVRRDEDADRALEARIEALDRQRERYDQRIKETEAERDSANTRATSKEVWANELVDSLRDELDTERRVRTAAEAETATAREETERVKQKARIQDEAVMQWARDHGWTGPPPPPS